jgi:hypothetical protein
MGSIWDDYKVDNIEQVLNLMNKSGTLHVFGGHVGGLPALDTGASHVQGVARYRDYLIMTHNSEAAAMSSHIGIEPPFCDYGSIVIINEKSNKVLYRIDTSDKGYNHPGGIQQIGDYLAVALEKTLENKRESCIRFYDLSKMSDNQPPILLKKPSIYRTGKKAGSVGITTFRKNGIEYFFVVVNDNGNVDFYMSNGKSLSDFQCEFGLVGSTTESADSQSMCLVTDKLENIYLIGFKSKDSDDEMLGQRLPGEDWADLYLVDAKNYSIQKINSYQFFSKYTINRPGLGVHFRYGAGIQIVSPQQINVLATRRNFSKARDNYMETNIFSCQLPLTPPSTPSGIEEKVTLDDTSPVSPALTSFNGRLYIGWKGNGNNFLNVMYSNDNGKTFGNKHTSTERSPEPPSLCVHNGNLYIAWKGDGNNFLNVARVITNGNIITGLSDKVTLDDTSPVSPALTSFNGRLYIGWKGDGNNFLNVMCSNDNGKTFGNKHTSAERSPEPPSLCVHNGNLYIAWKGDGNNNLNVAKVLVNGNIITGFSDKVTLDDTSPVSPALTSFNGRLYIGWKGDGNNFLNVMYSNDNAKTFGNKHTSTERSPEPPSLCVHNSNLYVAWKGDGNNNLNVARVLTDGNTIIDPAKIYKITSQKSGKVLDVKGGSTEDSVEIIQYDWHGGANQKWRFVPLHGDDEGYFEIASVNSGKCLDVNGGSTDRGTQIIQYHWKGQGIKNQQWKLTSLDSSDSIYKIECKHSKLVLDVKEGSLSNETDIIQWDWHGGSNQRWIITAV